MKNWPIAQGKSHTIKVKRKLTDAIESASLPQMKSQEVEPSEGKASYYIQIGSWRNINSAKAITAKLKKRYPYTHMVRYNTLHRIIMPGIRTQTQGQKIISEIETEFNLQPLLKEIK